MCLLIIILLYLMNISINIFLRLFWCVLSFQVTFNVNNYDTCRTLITCFYFLSLSDFLNELKFNHQVNKNTSTVVRVLSIQWYSNNKKKKNRTVPQFSARRALVYLQNVTLHLSIFRNIGLKTMQCSIKSTSCRPDFFIYGNETTQLVECFDTFVSQTYDSERWITLIFY